MRRDRNAPAGEVHRLWIDSKALASNMLGDPTRRIVDVYVPAGHDGAGLPLLVDLVGFSAGGPAHTNWKNYGENVPERLDRLIASGAMAPCVVAFPDCFTRLGGNQYVNSRAMGLWDDFLRDDMVALVENQFRCGGDGGRGVLGKSSGGYGAIAQALLHPEFWAAAACHSGDMGFEHCYIPYFPGVARALAKHGGSFEKWLTAFENAKKPPEGDGITIMMIAMAATYDPDPDAFCGVRLPFDQRTLALDAARWAEWMRWDPCVMVETRGAGLKQMKGVYIDCGETDQFNLVYGARRLHASLDELGVAHAYFEFPDNHSNVDYRMDESLPFLAKALSA